MGTGWSFPPEFKAGGGDLELVSDQEDIQQSLWILLSTSLGERIMREDYGCNLRDYQFEEMDRRLFVQVEQLVRKAIAFYETRIEVEEVDLSQSDNEAGLLLIQLTYKIRLTNSRYNLVYPFYVNEAIQQV